MLDAQTINRRNVVGEVISDTYGESRWSSSAANSLVDNFDRLLTKYPNPLQGVGNYIWDWFPGGDTAYGAAEKILTRLGIDYESDK